ncbi:MAG: MarR family transcriptional regulator [Bacteroidales bacterium]|nr:MarR family transcriptional regulator [Bacteroidales bacterium]
MKIEEELDGRFHSEYHKGVINLIYTANQLNYDFLCFLKKKDLTSQQYNVLKILRGFGKKPLSIDFIRKRMLDKHSDISRIIENLYKKKLIDRQENEKDRRQKDITITQQGTNLLKSIDSTEHKIGDLLKILTEEEIIMFNNLLDKIRG